MGWVCEKCICAVLTGSCPCPKCGQKRPGYIPSCDECGLSNETVSNVYIIGFDDPIPLCSSCKTLV